MAKKKPPNAKAGVPRTYPEANKEWRSFADKLGLKFESGRFRGPKIEGEYHGRRIHISLKSEGGGITPIGVGEVPVTYTVLTANIQSHNGKIELVPKDIDEWGGKLSSFFSRLRKIKILHDSKFEEKFVLYSTDEVFALNVFDANIRERILSMGETTQPRVFIDKKKARIKERGIATPERLGLWMTLLLYISGKIEAQNPKD